MHTIALGYRIDRMATVVLLGTLDTKGAEYAFLRQRLAQLGCDVVVVDAGTMGQIEYRVDISADDLARAAGQNRSELAAAADRGAAVAAMSDGARSIVGQLLHEGRLHGILAIGGSGGTTIASSAMRGLPIGVPKMIVSTMAAGDTRPYLGESDITMSYPIVDIAGLNSISRQILDNAAAAIAGMARAYAERTRYADASPKLLIGATMFGVTTPCVTVARERLEKLGYEVLVFHATGSGGRSMEALVRAGVLAGVLDVTTTELADELVGGVLSAGPERLEAAGAFGLPQVVSVGALDMVNFGPIETVPKRFRSRNLHVHNASVTLMRTTPQENAELGRTIAAKLSRAKGPLTLFVPSGGVSMIDAPGQPFHDPEADAALFETLKANLREDIEVIEMPVNINDPAFATAMVDRLHDLIQAGQRAGVSA